MNADYDLQIEALLKGDYDEFCRLTDCSEVVTSHHDAWWLTSDKPLSLFANLPAIFGEPTVGCLIELKEFLPQLGDYQHHEARSEHYWNDLFDMTHIPALRTLRTTTVFSRKTLEEHARLHTLARKVNPI